MEIQTKLILAALFSTVIFYGVVLYAGLLNPLTIMVALLLIFSVSFFISRVISKRIVEVHEVINAVSKGDITKRVPIETEDEMDRLGRDLNTMIENLIEARRLPENILRSMKDGLFVVDVEGIITEANQAASEMLGLAKEELIGKSVTDIFSEYQRT